MSYLNARLFKSKKYFIVYQDIYKIKYLNSEFHKNGKVKKHHCEIQVKRFAYVSGKFKKIADIKISTKYLERFKAKNKI